MEIENIQCVEVNKIAMILYVIINLCNQLSITPNFYII